MQVKRVYVEKKKDYQILSLELFHQVKEYLEIKSVESIRVLTCYDIENISEDTYNKALVTVFSEPPLDYVYEEFFQIGDDEVAFGVEFLPGQFDQRADSAVQCMKLLNENEEPIIRSSMIYVIKGQVSKEEIEKIKNYCINPVDSREASLEKPTSLVQNFVEPDAVEIIDGFILKEKKEIDALYKSLNLAMTYDDFEHIYNYYKNTEKRNPSITEIRVLDTYWSDHCRHTTFLTELKNVTFEDGFYNAPIRETYESYLKARKTVYKDRAEKDISLMDMALMAMRELRLAGKLEDLEESDEINACSIIVPVEIDGKTEEWLVMFKNETHNHPTEIEPFGGAATCLGGAIRDPLSGRSYVYQAMRVTGAADPTVDIKETLSGKLPQRKITTEAAEGYSSYGNQIGLATGLVSEVYHPNYVAKRMEIGAVIAAAPRKNVIRGKAEPGDMIILLGGRTGRDGCGGATGSSKVHTEESILACGAEVQKGNAPTERKIQRLFRKEEVSQLIKKCNDFGAGGVAVAIGELADGLNINLDLVPKKYEGLDGTELAISESQERMAVVVDRENAEQFIAFAEKENLEAKVVAQVTEEPRLVMTWKNKIIVNLSRAFLDTNGAHQEAEVEVLLPSEKENYFASKDINNVREEWLKTVSDLNVCSQKGMVEHFDSSIGAGSVLMPFGGKYQRTPVQAMVAKVPVLNGETTTATMMSYGFDPALSSWSPYHGAMYAVIDSVAKIVATGGDYKNIRFTFQEYFKRLNNDPKRWGEPFSALLGAYKAQKAFELPSIGGKDSMSGSFNDIDVPPTLVSFAVTTTHIDNIITPELKEADHKLIKVTLIKDNYDLPDFEELKKNYDEIVKLTAGGKVYAAYALGYGGICEAISKMAFGNEIGVTLNEAIAGNRLFEADYGSIILEIDETTLELLNEVSYEVIGTTINEKVIQYNDMIIPLDDVLNKWVETLEEVFPTKSSDNKEILDTPVYEEKRVNIGNPEKGKPQVFVPVFPGTNCEYDTLRAFEKAGANVKTVVFKNLNPSDIRESIETFTNSINESQILMIPGGFSAGDEPEGSGKFIATVFRNEKVKEAVMTLLNKRDGLGLGICNGFQALIKLGLVPYGDIRDQKDDSPTLTMNTIGRHISLMANTKIVSNKSPWFSNCKVGDIHTIPLSHGEGRFVASKEWIDQLFKNGQVATQYVDFDGKPTMNETFNPNGSYYAIEGITSPDGRILGKMGHSERIGTGVAKNIIGNQDQKIFKSGVEYFL
ncbi:phosphoribosylformylglycinamidine synthase [Natranaerovirga pectinivora]|uniref:Phosphoribosylformylglycinamidine synthase n=1 Tax=Natranaerovirga pectinivora TaxID=682400 RepID=A0A4R3MQC2_9FIRM|nr:phosphoribosylformylglycinamidine synthase [Natranaerovirga pectinivora]TCT16723.1 phosphoribosylformylglycinamidine synthase [Natranaerovirga pectinivora]